MASIKARCTNCGEEIMTDNSRDAAICPFCMEPYVVEKAIRKYGYSAEELLRLLPVEEEEKASTKGAGKASVRGEDPHIYGDAPNDPKSHKDHSNTFKNGDSKDKEAAVEAGSDSPAALASLGEEEQRLVERVLQTILQSKSETVSGCFKWNDTGNAASDQGVWGGFEPEEEIRKRIAAFLDMSLISPSPSGTGLAELMMEYKEKYAAFDILKETMKEEAVVEGLRAVLVEKGFSVSRICLKPMTLNRCEFYEVKEFFGRKTRKEKKLVSKEIRALFVECQRPEKK